MEMSTPAPLLHTVPAVLKMLSIGRTTLYKLVDSGDIKIVKIGNKSLITDNNIRELVAARVEKSA